jgi:hypothetical protein
MSGGIAFAPWTASASPATSALPRPSSAPALSAVASTGPGSWQYVPIDADRAAACTYGHYKGHGCMYAVFRGIVESWGLAQGESAVAFPFAMFDYGHGGAGGYGSLCGALNGAAAAVGLFEPAQRVRDVLIADLFKWYERSALPVFAPAPVPGSTAPTAVAATSVAGSVLCHASIARWSKVTRADPYSTQRGERCRRLSADVARRTVALLNANVDVPRREVVVRDDSASCMQCHAPQGHAPVTVRTLMSCSSCHTVPPNHPVPSLSTPGPVLSKVLP